MLDAGSLILHFPAPKTVTGEDILELHVHGGPAVVKAVLEAIPKCVEANSSRHTIRYAEAGEFTRRAFMNDRLDLTQIEALGDTLAADTEQQRRLAVKGANATLAQRYETWRQQLLYARGEMEALIDFSEDQHFDESATELVESIADQVRSLHLQISAHIENASKGELLRKGIDVALLGAPNAGKSSLLNRIVGREAAIVSSEEGTTRDIVDVGVDIGGYLCKLGDMAGLRRAMVATRAGSSPTLVGEIEMEGIRRAKARALKADVVIVVLSIEDDPGVSGMTLRIDEEVVEAANNCLQRGKQMLVVVNKSDKLGSLDNADILQFKDQVAKAIPNISHDRITLISCQVAQALQTKQQDAGNIQTFLTNLIKTFKDVSSPTSSPGSESSASYWEDSLGVTVRQSLSLKMCLKHLSYFLDSIAVSKLAADVIDTTDLTRSADEIDFDIVARAEDLRFAADCLARITGKGEAGDVEEVLGVVFEK